MILFKIEICVPSGYAKAFEINVWVYFTTRFTRVKNLKETRFNESFEFMPEFHNISVLKLDDIIQPDIVDYVLTGIPYADNVLFY